MHLSNIFWPESSTSANFVDIISKSRLLSLEEASNRGAAIIESLGLSVASAEDVGVAHSNVVEAAHASEHFHFAEEVLRQDLGRKVLKGLELMPADDAESRVANARLVLAQVPELVPTS